MRIAVLMTCHNRSTKTLDSLRALSSQISLSNVEVEIFLVDDGSTDNTSKLVRENFPVVHILTGDGNLYWNGGMRLAFEEALKHDFDFYLWLNDDTCLYCQGISLLLQTYLDVTQLTKHIPIIVGSTQDETGRTSYGGVKQDIGVRRLRFTLVEPGVMAKVCDTMNGNCVLIPRSVAAKVGNLDSSFTHGMGDFDYGLKARQLGFSIWIAPGYVGTCQRNVVAETFLDTSLSLPVRLKKVREPKGLPPREWLVFSKRYAGFLWFLYWISPYFKIFVQSFFVQKSNQKK